MNCPNSRAHVRIVRKNTLKAIIATQVTTTSGLAVGVAEKEKERDTPHTKALAVPILVGCTTATHQNFVECDEKNLWETCPPSNRWRMPTLLHADIFFLTSCVKQGLVCFLPPPPDQRRLPTASWPWRASSSWCWRPWPPSCSWPTWPWPTWSGQSRWASPSARASPSAWTRTTRTTSRWSCPSTEEKLGSPTNPSTVETWFYVFFRQRGKIRKIGSS